MEEQLISRLEAAVARLEALSSGSRSISVSDEAGGGVDASAAASDPSILAFDDLTGSYLARVSGAAEKIGGQVLNVTKVLVQAFAAQKELLIKIKQSPKPDMSGMGEFLTPLNEVIVKANSMTEGRRSDFFIHLKAAADSLSALAWIAYTGKDCGMSMPIAHVEESWQMAEFYNNKILVEYKSKDPNHVEWAKALKELYLPGLKDYVKSNYPLGPVWCTSAEAATPAPPKAPKPGAPAPPPPPSASLFASDSAKPSSSKLKVGMSAVFEEISSGKPVTAGLIKVTDDMKSKNRTDRTGVVSAAEKESRSGSRSISKIGPPRLELQMGSKWVVENQIGKKNLVIDDCDAKQSVYVFGCKDSVLQIQGKVNNITVDKCTKMGVVFQDVVAAFEIVNSNGVEVQCQGSATTISVDNTGGCQLYLSKDSLATSITTAKSSEINVLVPGADPDGDWVEHSLPQQFVHKLKDGRFETTPVSHSGGMKLYVLIAILAACALVATVLVVLCVRVRRAGGRRVKHSSGLIPVVSQEILEINTITLEKRFKEDSIAAATGEAVLLRKEMPSSSASPPAPEPADDVEIGSCSSGCGGDVAAVVEQGNIGWGKWYSMRELEVATRGFAEGNVIGKGGYGVVYRGVLPDGSVVAVKSLLNNKGQAEKEFKVEVESIGKVRHKNLVGLIGYCAEGDRRLLLYEYVDNGNLEQWLHGDVGPLSPLTWDIRMKIAIGTAKGLAYLHEGLEPKVLHRDVKSSNILLDRMWNPKVSDFGLAKLLGSEASYVTTRVMGTFGYVSPDYASTGMLNEGSDVYSFGVLLMEMITGRSPIDYSRPAGEMNLVDWLKEMVASRQVEEIVDPLIEIPPPPRALKRALLVCLRCIDLDASKRPKMGQIVHMLEADDFPYRAWGEKFISITSGYSPSQLRCWLDTKLEHHFPPLASSGTQASERERSSTTTPTSHGVYPSPRPREECRSRRRGEIIKA